MPRVFPQYSDGDVEIHLTGDKNDTLVLHSYVLALHSSWFKAALSDQWTTVFLTDASNRQRWVYELRFDQDSPLGMLMPVNGTEEKLIFLSSKAKRMPDTESEKAMHDQRLDSVKSHHELFGTFYHLLLPSVTKASREQETPLAICALLQTSMTAATSSRCTLKIICISTAPKY